MTLPIRPRRLRASETMRRMVRDIQLSPNDFIYPLFVVHGRDIRRPISSMPGVAQLSVDQARREAGEAVELGIPAIILFGLPAEKDPIGRENFAENGIVQQTARAIKAEYPELMVITDVCLCEYTDHGHCGLVNPETGEILNDETLEVLQKVALSHAAAGADIVAPSGMIDGMVGAMRAALDQAGFCQVTILS